jgi:ubiquinone/menaquinone biosynthesis C-methylase UbiE
MKSRLVCPWWMGYLLASPIRRLGQDPHHILSPHVGEGMTVLEAGPGMGFFTLELARLVGDRGRVFAVDVEPRMLSAIARRAGKAHLEKRIELRRSKASRMGVDDVAGQVDFVLAFAVVHELPDAEGFFGEMYQVLRPEGRMLLSEPTGHVNVKAWDETVLKALRAGFRKHQDLDIWRERSVLLLKPSTVEITPC